MGVEYIIKNALLRRTLDNVTVVLVAFDNFYRTCYNSEPVNNSINSHLNCSANIGGVSSQALGEDKSIQ